MSKERYTVEARIQAAKRYLQGEKSARIIAAEMGMGKRGEVKVREWAAIYSENGIEGFHLKKGNSHYTAELKRSTHLSGRAQMRS